MSLRTQLVAAAPLLGAWKQMSEPLAAETVSRLGFDWIGIDTQHGMIGYEGMLAMLQAAAVGGTPAIVRVPSHDPATIGRALDSGAEGVIVPVVETAQQAALAVAACRYPPEGVRSWGAIRPSLAGSYTPAIGNDQAVCLVMIETVLGVENVDEIIGVPGVDGVYIGPADLAISAALPPSLHPAPGLHEDLVERIVAACRRQGTPVGIHAWGQGRAAACLAGGFRLLAVHLDVSALREGALAVLEEARACARDEAS